MMPDVRWKLNFNPVAVDEVGGGGGGGGDRGVGFAGSGPAVLQSRFGGGKTVQSTR